MARIPIFNLRSFAVSGWFTQAGLLHHGVIFRTMAYITMLGHFVVDLSDGIRMQNYVHSALLQLHILKHSMYIKFLSKNFSSGNLMGVVTK